MGFSFRSQPQNDIGNTSQYINFFLNKGVDPNKPDRFGIYPLQHAMQIKSLPFVQALLNSGKIDYSIKINTDRITNGTYLHLAAFSSEEITKQLITSNVFDLEFKDDLGRTPYMIAEEEIKKKDQKDSGKSNYSFGPSKNKTELDAISQLLRKDHPFKTF